MFGYRLFVVDSAGFPRISASGTLSKVFFIPYAPGSIRVGSTLGKVPDAEILGKPMESITSGVLYPGNPPFPGNPPWFQNLPNLRFPKSCF